jgi:hypothetical protein
MQKSQKRQGSASSKAVPRKEVAPCDDRVTTPHDQHRIIYLACPYTHPDHTVRAKRFRLATAAAADLIRQGHIVYSPITMTHPIDVLMAGDTNTLGSDYWVEFDEAFMAMCAEMVVLQIEGWDKSNGVQREIDYFRSRGKPIHFRKDDQTAPARLDFASVS